MTIADRQTELLVNRAAAPAPPATAKGTPTLVTIRWTVDAGALGAALGFKGVVKPGDAGAVEWTVAADADGTLTATAAAIVERRGAVVAREGVRSGVPVTRITDAAGGFDHLDAGGALAVTIRRGPGGPPTVVYAATTALANLGIPGGRYEAPTARE